MQHYGRVFDYARRAVDFDQPCRPFPAAVRAIADRALAQGLLPEPADQCTINEYLPGQARAPSTPRHRTRHLRRGPGEMLRCVLPAHMKVVSCSESGFMR